MAAATRRNQDERDERDEQRDDNAAEMRVDIRYMRDAIRQIQADIKTFTASNLEARVKALENARQADSDARANDRKEIRQFVFNVGVGVITVVLGTVITLYLSHFGGAK